MNVFLTGGTGFFGRALLRSRLNNESYWNGFTDITVLSRDPEGFYQQYPEFADLHWLKFHRGDVLVPESLPSGQYTHVLHAAADSTFGALLTPLQRYDQIVLGTRNILDFAVKTGANKFLLTSSGAVYGKLPLDINCVDESYNGMPDPMVSANVYGVAKREAEHLCALYQDQFGLDCVVARCFAFVGRDLPLNAHFAIGNFIRDAIEGNEITVKGDGTALRSYLSQEDLSAWLMALICRGKTNNAYNVGSDEAITISDLAYKVRDLVSPTKPVKILAKASTSERSKYLPNIAKAKKELGLMVITPLEGAILKTVEHYKKKT